MFVKFSISIRYIQVLISPVIVFTLSLLWLPFQVAYALTSNHSSIPAIPFGIAPWSYMFFLSETAYWMTTRCAQKPIIPGLILVNLSVYKLGLYQL